MTGDSLPCQPDSRFLSLPPELRQEILRRTLEAKPRCPRCYRIAIPLVNSRSLDIKTFFTASGPLGYMLVCTVFKADILEVLQESTLVLHVKAMENMSLDEYNSLRQQKSHGFEALSRRISYFRHFSLDIDTESFQDYTAAREDAVMRELEYLLRTAQVTSLAIHGVPSTDAIVKRTCSIISDWKERHKDESLIIATSDPQWEEEGSGQVEFALTHQGDKILGNELRYKRFRRRIAAGFSSL